MLVVSKRFGKKQQMRWTQPGAHLLLQVRVQIINQDWQSTFRTALNYGTFCADVREKLEYATLAYKQRYWELLHLQGAVAV